MSGVERFGVEARVVAQPFRVNSHTNANVTEEKPPAAFATESLARRLAERLDDTPERLMRRVADMKRGVREMLLSSSNAFQILDQLEESGLRDCARCTRELEERLATNPHYIVLGKLEEAERAVRKAGQPKR